MPGITELPGGLPAGPMGFPKTYKEPRITKGDHANNLLRAVVLKCSKEEAWQVRRWRWGQRGGVVQRGGGGGGELHTGGGVEARQRQERIPCHGWKNWFQRTWETQEALAPRLQDLSWVLTPPRVGPGLGSPGSVLRCQLPTLL